MDIAKYIGLFLLKNHYCYVHGLGNMELKKRPAIYDGKALQAPSYEVVVTHGGSIDDNLANFIATSEQISISKAANTLREYSMQVRKDISEGRESAIPNIGKFVEENGKVKFITDNNFSFTPAGIPTIRNSKQLDEQNSRPVHKPSSYPAPAKASSVNWSMVVLVIVLLAIIGGGGYGVYYYMYLNKSTPTTVVPVPDTVAKAVAPPVVDTTAMKKDTSVAGTPAAVSQSPQPATDSLQKYPWRIVIGNYRTKEKADFRITTLTKNGNKVEMIPKDSTNFLVVTTIRCRTSDTTHVMDSLKRLFGYKGTMIIR